MAQAADSYDYVIIGAGSAGCTVANRLSADPTIKVLVLEAGGWDRHPFIKLPLAWGKVLVNRIYDWGYDSEPMATMLGRRIECARGKAVGGSSSINAMAYVRGNRGDFDRWASYGLPGWSYDNVLPYFRKQESWERGANAYRGGSGPLSTQKARYEDPLLDAYLGAASAAGYAMNDDYNGETQDGFSRMQMTIRKGHRESAATAYLHPVRGRRNLTVSVKSHVLRIAFNGRRASGVDYKKDGKTRHARAVREVILCGGTINSPQVLQLSGIGDPALLATHNIAVKAALPGVGQNLQDHAAALLVFGRRDTSPFLRNMRLDRAALGFLQGMLLGTGFMTDLPGGITGFIKTEASKSMPDIQLLFLAGSLLGKPYVPPFQNPFADTFACRIVLLRPESRGSVTIGSADAFKHPRIDMGLLATANDWATLRNGVEIFRELARRPELKEFVSHEIGPGAGVTTDAQLEDYVRKTAVTAHHPAGTCKMGVDTDPMAVVDADLRVRGVDNLRVVDASVFPDLVGGNINAPTIMIAERAANWIMAGE